MIRRILGAAFGGTTRGGHHGCESLALSLMTPPNFRGGGGSCLPSIVIVALGEPGVPLIRWAIAPGDRLVPRRMLNDSAVAILVIPLLLKIVASVESHAPFLIARRSGPMRDAPENRKEML